MSRIYDSSFLTQRRGEKAAAGAFYSQVTNGPSVRNLGFPPMLGIKDSSILYSVKQGSMTEYARLPGCIQIDPGCPCATLNASVSIPPYVPLVPGLVPGIVFTVGSIILTWQAPTGEGPFTYQITPYLGSTALSMVSTNELTYRFTNLQSFSYYTFQICAKNDTGMGPVLTVGPYMAPPEDLGVILQGQQAPFDIGPSMNYVMNAGLNQVLQYCASINLGPTLASRVMYLWVASVVQAWNWVSSETRVTGTIDQWNWDLNGGILNECDSVIWICKVIDHVTPILIPSYVPIYQYSESNVTRVKTSGQWDNWLSNWNVWYGYRQQDGYVAATTTMPASSANWNNTIVVDGVTVNNIAGYPQPQQWTRLTVNGKMQKYLTYTWDSVLSTCMTELNEMDIQNTVTPVTGSARDLEIDSVLNTTANLTDVQKVYAEFWAGSSAGSISPPFMGIWLWKEYVRSIGVNCETLMFSLLDLSIHMFEVGRVVWRLKAAYLQDRPIQEIRRRFAGQPIQSWNGLIDGAQWTPYQKDNFVTPPFADFSSGHSGFMKSFALTMNKWFGSSIIKNTITYDRLPLMCPLFTNGQTDAFGDFIVPSQSSLIQSSVPALPVTLSFQVWEDIANQAGMSRIYGGIHTLNAHTASQTVAVQVDGFINSTWNIATA